MKSLTSRDAATGATLRSWTGGSFLGTSRRRIPAITISKMMMNQIVIMAPNVIPLPVADGAPSGISPTPEYRQMTATSWHWRWQSRPLPEAMGTGAALPMELRGCFRSASRPAIGRDT
jgi:hypothetical protein